MNRPLLHFTLELLHRHGVRNVIVNLHHLPSSVMEAVGDGREFGIRVSYSRETRILGTGGGPRRVLDFFEDEPFFLVNGDVVCDFDLTALFMRHVRSGARATLALLRNPDPRHYSVVVTGKDGRLLSLGGLPRRSSGISSLFTGVQVVDPRLLRSLPPGSSDIVRDLYSPSLARGEHLIGVRVRGRWWDFGSPALYLASHGAMIRARLKAPRAVDLSARVHPTSRVLRSVVGPRARIEAGARVEGSVLWEGSIVGRGARVSGSILAGGVLEPGGELRGALRLPQSHGGEEVPL